MVIPKVTGPVPVTPTSYPLMASWDIDLSTFGYVEEEFFISGVANTNEWSFISNSEGDMPDLPYTDRILVRRPANPNKFSGNVIVEPIHTGAGSNDQIWGRCCDYIIARGDAWVGITQPKTVPICKTFHPVRYGPLHVIHDMMMFAIISQVGKLLKTQDADNPLNGFNVEYLYATGYSETCLVVINYINFFHKTATIDGTKPVYDGYLPIALGVRTQTPLMIEPCNVPVIQVQTQSEILNSYMMRRPNGDEPGNQFRRYEVPGATHIYKEPFNHGVSPEDLVDIGIERRTFDSAIPYILNDFPLQYILNGALANLDLWVRDGTPPPQSDHIALVNMDSPEVKFVFDDFGNVVGGVRTPYVDVPIATYHLGYPDPGAAYKIPFVNAFLKLLYGDHDGYVNQVAQATEKILKDRWITETDAKKIIREAEDSDVLVNKEN